MSMLETSGGKDLNHRRMETGMHAGTAAQGRVGIMPHTAQELANRKRLSKTNDAVDDAIRKADPKVVEQYLQQYPEKLEEYENKLAEQVLTKTGGDPKLAAGAWLYGHNDIDYSKKKLEKDLGYQKRIEDTIESLGLYSEQPEFVDQLLDKSEPKFKNIQSKVRGSEQWPSIKLKKP